MNGPDALWYASLVALVIAVAPLDVGIHPIIRYALGAVALITILFTLEVDEIENDEVAVKEANNNSATTAAGGEGVIDADGEDSSAMSKQRKREKLKEDIRRKILSDVCRTAGDDAPSGSVAEPSRQQGDKKDAPADPEDGTESQEDETEDSSTSNNSNTWRCACENGFLPPGLLKNFSGAEAVMRMGMGQCYHKSGV